MKSPSLDLEIGVREREEQAFPTKRLPAKHAAEDEPSFVPTKRLTMIPAKYKLKEERRKVLKISISKLKKIDDPESWLCRSVLINNTMRKLQKEARDEKMQKQMSVYAKTYFDDCQLNNNNEDCVYQRDENKRSGEEASSLTNGVPLNEDVVEKIPSIKRCASRKRSFDEDGPADLLLDQETKLDSKPEVDDIEDCDMHDVLSQLYMPPTPRLLTSIDSDTDDDDLNIVDMDASYIESKPVDEFEAPPSKKQKQDNNFLCGDKSVLSDRTCGSKEDEEDIELEDEEDIKRRLSLGAYRCDAPPLPTNSRKPEGLFDDAPSLSSSYRKPEAFFDDSPSLSSPYRKPETLFDEAPSLSSQYRKSEGLFDEPPSLDPCDTMYSCGHTSLFNDIHSVTFHNLIASLET